MRARMRAGKCVVWVRVCALHPVNAVILSRQALPLPSQTCMVCMLYQPRDKTREGHAKQVALAHWSDDEQSTCVPWKQLGTLQTMQTGTPKMRSDQ